MSDYGFPAQQLAGPPRGSGVNKTVTWLAVAVTVLVLAVVGEVLVIRRPVATEPLATTAAQFQQAANTSCVADYRALVAPARSDGNNPAALIDLTATGIVKLSASVNAAPHARSDFGVLDEISVLSARLAGDLQHNANKLAAATASRSLFRSITSQTRFLQQTYLQLGLDRCVVPNVRGAPNLLG